MVRRALSLVAASLLPAAILAGLALAQTRTTVGPPGARTPTELLTAPLPTTGPEAAQIQLGRNLVIAGDCLSCHTRPGGVPMAGGYAMQTPFGVIYTPNLTSDRQTGIGGWTPDQFYQALHTGRDDVGRYLYPAFPYVNFTNVTRQDSDAMLAYLKTVPAVSYTPPANKLPFPLNIRLVVWGWNLLFFRPHTFQPEPGQSAQWNRGAYLVRGLGHCGGCHTPANFLGAAEKSKSFYGGYLEYGVPPDLTANPRTGLGSWTVAEVTEYLKTGRNGRAQASGPMTDVISYSTSLMSDTDLQAIAVYLKSRPASPSPSPSAPDPASMRRGAAIYSDACASCHLEQGRGQPRYFPPLGHDAVVQQANPDGVLHMILAGTRTATTLARPSPMTMPSFAWKLTDQEVADVTTYLRNSWGNRASPVSADRVAYLRRKLDLKTSSLTQNSGDHY
ncbi:MAG: cytochrome c [Phenylobacterium sp.]|nr:cytochrome c [Phenylobacterium sp.]